MSVYATPDGMFHRCDHAPIGDTRIRESEFRARRPRQIDGIEIVAITAFDGGSIDNHTYARATVITHTSSFSTHTLLYLDDRGERNGFVLEHGHYDFPTRAAAEDDARTRTLV